MPSSHAYLYVSGARTWQRIGALITLLHVDIPWGFYGKLCPINTTYMAVEILRDIRR